MFDELKAWFSSSVDGQTKQLWKNHGGYESDFDAADFIFSADNTAPDTQRVFSSSAYVLEHLEVFHPCYIGDCVKAGSRHDIVLGHYILPPQGILNDVRKHITLCWDHHVDPQNQNQMPPLGSCVRQARFLSYFWFEDIDNQANISAVQQSRPSNRKVIIRTPSRSQTARNTPVPQNPGPSGTTRRSLSFQPHRTGTIPNAQSANTTARQNASSSSSQQGLRSDGVPPSIRSSENRAAHTGERHLSLNQSQEPARGTVRQIDEGRRDSSRQLNRNLETQSPDKGAGQKRVTDAPTSARSPVKRRNIVHTGHGDSSRETVQQNLGPIVGRDGLTHSTNSHSNQVINSPQERETTENNSVMTAKDKNTPRRRATVTARTSPHLHYTSGGNEMGEKSGNTVTEEQRMDASTEDGIYHISQLMKVMADELSDFIPKEDGAEVYHKSVC